MSHSVVIIEDETTLAKNIKTYLQRHDYEVQLADDGKAGIELCRTAKPDVVLLDLHLADMDGLAVLAQLRQLDPQLKIIMMTAHGNIQTAVEAMKAGAYDYLSKPLVLSELVLLLSKALEHMRLEKALSYYHDREAHDSGLGTLLGDSPAMQALHAQLQQLLHVERTLTDADLPTVLITGETGTGKELIARALHYEGRLQQHPFVEINCAAIPAQLLEAELFGYEPGAFTDARERKTGLFEAADGGTLFLDEIGDMDLALQTKLLKTFEDKMVRRLGSLRARHVTVRMITATNQNLEDMVRQGKFRADLYFRLRVITVNLPPLRQRHNDIIQLAQHFLALHSRRYGRPSMRLSPAAEAALLRHAWPGNVRELRNVMEQAVLLSRQDVIGPEALALTPGFGSPASAESSPTARFTLPAAGICLDDVERHLVVQALEQTSWNVTRAAKLLGLSRDTMRYRMEKFALTPL